MNKSKATTALKSLLVSGCALFVWGMTPVFLASTLTSCEKLEDILGGGDEDEDDENGDGSSSGNLNGVGTTDGAAPYFNLETTRIELPAVRDGEGIQVKCQTNIMSMRYVLEKFKKFSEGELTEQEDYSFILENPEYSFYGEEYLQYYTNYSSEKQTDNLLIYATDKDSLLATIPIEQAAAPHISVAKADAGINEITLTLEGQNDARFYSTYISTDSIPLFEVIQDLKNGGSGLPFEYLFDLQSQPTCTFSGLTEATKYYIYLQGGTEPGPLHGLSLYTVTTAMRGKEDALIMKYALNNLNNRTVYLPFEGRVKGVIDWGDGMTEVLDKSYVYSADLSHAYPQGAESTVEVAFKGTVESLATNSTTKGEILKSSLIGITQWGTPELKTLRLEDVTALTQLAADTKGALSAITDFTSCFEGCTGLTNLPEDLFAMATGAETFDRAFQGCTGLTSLPLNLFAQNSSARNFNETFSSCTGLLYLPEDLFANNKDIYVMNDVFSGCENLKEIPAGLFRNNTRLGYIQCAFSGCSSLTSLPEGLFANCPGIQSVSEINSVMDAYGLFSNCTSLTEIPEDLFASMTKVTRLDGIFKGCTSLREIPEKLFANNTQVISMWEAFAGCKSLQRIPTGLFDSMRTLQAVRLLFKSCSSLTGESPYTLINGKKVHLYERKDYPNEFLEITSHTSAFNNCTNLTDYESIPSNWK